MKTTSIAPILVFTTLALFNAACVSSGPAVGPTSPDDAARANTELAARYLQRGDVEHAMEKVNRALDQNDEYAEAYLVKGMILARAEEFGDADDYYLRAARYGKDNTAVLGNVAAYLCNRSRFEDGEEIFLDIARMPTYARPAIAYSNAALCAKRIPALDRAEKHLRRALEFEANYPQALSLMAEISFAQEDWLGTRAFIQRLEGVQRLGPDMLLLGARAERQLGDRAAERRYADILRRDFPDSAQAAQIESQP